MISRRVATFLLGIWIGCCLLTDLLTLQTDRASNRFLDNPTSRGSALVEGEKKENAAIILHHVSREQTRALLSGWELAQLGLAAGIGILLIFSDQRKLVPILMCSAMAAITAAQAFLITPSLTDLGRELDFLAASSAAVTMTRVAMSMQTYAILEVIKLLIGGALASYFFMMESTVRRSHRNRSGTRAQEAAAAAPVKPA